MVIPESGLDEEPTIPVMRAETTEKRNPNTIISTAPSIFTRNSGTIQMNKINAITPSPTMEIGVSFSVRGISAATAFPPRSAIN